MDVLYKSCCGLDVHKETVAACILIWEAGRVRKDKRIFGTTTRGLLELREQPQPQWQTAYAYRGGGSTRERRNAVESIYARWVPIPTGIGDADAEEFLDDVKSKVI